MPNFVSFMCIVSESFHLAGKEFIAVSCVSRIDMCCCMTDTFTTLSAKTLGYLKEKKSLLNNLIAFHSINLYKILDIFVNSLLYLSWTGLELYDMFFSIPIQN